MNHQPPVVFLVGSRTGGPLIPLLALKDELLASRPDLRFVIVGVPGGFEEQAAKAEQLELLFLPEVKGPRGGPVGRLFSAFGVGVALAFSTFRALLYVRSHQPALVLSMSNFLSVPVIWACAITNRWRGVRNRVFAALKKPPRPRIQTSLHQLDIENLTSRLAGRFADSYSAGLTEICSKDPAIRFFPNPVRRERFDALKRKDARDILTENGLYERANRRPLLLVFGGGSGAQFINEWVVKNLPELTTSFFVIHLTGFLQEKQVSHPATKSYRPTPGLTELMPAAMVAADVVICRAGMSTISELLYLKKNAYLVPIPQSHQVVNARAVARYFRILEQPQVADWTTLLISDKRDSFPKHKRVKWDYYNAEQHHAFRDHLLGMLRAPSSAPESFLS